MRSAIKNLFGAKNGRKFGMKYCIAVKNVEETNKKDAQNNTPYTWRSIKS